MSQGFTGGVVTTFTGTGSTVRQNQPTINQANLVGTTTNDNAAAGSVGQLLETIVLIGSAVTLTTATAANMTSVSLTAGDWDVWGEIWFTGGGTTLLQRADAAITSTSALIPTAPASTTSQILNFGSASAFGSIGPPVFVVSQTRITIASTTTIYLPVRAYFTVSTCSAYGMIAARRVR